MFRAVITGCGSYTPKRVMENREFESIVDTSHEWIVQRTGIHRRHIAADGETTADLGEHAARAALKDAGCRCRRDRPDHFGDLYTQQHVSSHVSSKYNTDWV